MNDTARNMDADTRSLSTQLSEAELAKSDNLISQISAGLPHIAAEQLIGHLALADRYERVQRIKEFKGTVSTLRTHNADLLTANASLQAANAALTERIAGLRTHRFASALLFTVGGVILGLWHSLPNGPLSLVLGVAGIALIGGAAFMNLKH